MGGREMGVWISTANMLQQNDRYGPSSCLYSRCLHRRGLCQYSRGRCRSRSHCCRPALTHRVWGADEVALLPSAAEFASTVLKI